MKVLPPRSVRASLFIRGTVAMLGSFYQGTCCGVPFAGTGRTTLEAKAFSRAIRFDLRPVFAKSLCSGNQARQRIDHGTSCAARRHGDGLDEFAAFGLVTRALLEQLVGESTMNSTLSHAPELSPTTAMFRRRNQTFATSTRQ